MPNGKAKSNRALYSESVPEMCDNILKEIKLDTGGTDGCIPKAIVAAVSRIQKLSPTDAAHFLMKRDNHRMTAVRRAVMRRTLAIKCLDLELPFDDYQAMLDDKLKTTIKSKYKKPIRRILCRK